MFAGAWQWITQGSFFWFANTYPAMIAFAMFAGSYLVGSIPWAYIIVCNVAKTDITEHGTGNVGAMNVRRTTGSWGWFVVAMVADALKGILPVATAWLVVGTPQAMIWPGGFKLNSFLPAIAILGAVLGHNFSVWMALVNRRFERTGKGLATGGGALIAYDWRYFVVVVVVGLLVIFISRYMMAGQVAAAWSLPLGALALRSQDWPFMLLLGGVVYSAHHKRFLGLLKGKEPKFYINDRMGPKG